MRWLDEQLLLRNSLFPITSRLRLLRATVPAVSTALDAHLSQGHFVPHPVTQREVVGGLERTLRELLPLREAETRFAVVPTRSEWTAVFSNALQDPDPGIEAALARRIDCDRIDVLFAPSPGVVRVGGTLAEGRSFHAWRPPSSGGTSLIRGVYAIEEDGWAFGSHGHSLTGEPTDPYSALAISDRLSVGQLRALCTLFKVDPFDRAFYDVPARPSTLLHWDLPVTLDRPEHSLMEAQSELRTNGCEAVFKGRLAPPIIAPEGRPYYGDDRLDGPVERVVRKMTDSGFKVRVRQTQTIRGGLRVGINRPAVQAFHRATGRTYHVILQGNPHEEEAGSAERIIANDPGAGVIVVKLEP